LVGSACAGRALGAAGGGGPLGEAATGLGGWRGAGRSWHKPQTCSMEPHCTEVG
jgi:hypothetical protein